MANGTPKVTVSLVVDGEEPFHLSPGSGAPGLVLGRGGQSSPFLRKRLSDVSISREHVRVEALPCSDGDIDDAATASARVTVLGSNPVVLIRRQPPGGKTLIRRGESAVAEAGDGFTFCRGFDGVVRVATVVEAAGRAEDEPQEHVGKGSRGGDEQAAGTKTTGAAGGDGDEPAGTEGVVDQAESRVAVSADGPLAPAPIADLAADADAPEVGGRRRQQLEDEQDVRDFSAAAAAAAAAAAPAVASAEVVVAEVPGAEKVGAGSEGPVEAEAGSDTCSDGLSTVSESSATEKGRGAGDDGGMRRVSGANGAGNDGGGRRAATVDDEQGGGVAGYNNNVGAAVEGRQKQLPRQRQLDDRGPRLRSSAEDDHVPQESGNRVAARATGEDNNSSIGNNEPRPCPMLGGAAAGGGDSRGSGMEYIVENEVNEAQGELLSSLSQGVRREGSGGNGNDLSSLPRGARPDGSGENGDNVKKRARGEVSREGGSEPTGLGGRDHGPTLENEQEQDSESGGDEGEEDSGSRQGDRGGDGSGGRRRRRVGGSTEPLREAGPPRQPPRSRAEAAEVAPPSPASEDSVSRRGGGHDVAAASAGAALAGLRVALVGGGLSKKRQELFRQRGAKLGMEVLVRPEAKEKKPPSLSELLPIAGTGGAGGGGKGRKRRRTGSGVSSSSGSNRERQEESPRGRRHSLGSGGSGGGGLLERLRREGFAVAVCSSDATPPWGELLGPGAPAELPVAAAAAGTGVGACGGEDGVGRVEVVRDGWLVSCLREQRRVPTGPYVLSPLPESAGDSGEDGAKERKAGGAPVFVVPQYACQRRSPMKHHNQEIVAVLDEMSKMYKVAGDGQRADSFQRLASILRSLDRRVRSGSEVAHAHHVGDRMVEFVDEIINTGTLSRLQELKSNPQNMVCRELMKVHGVGPKTAREWYNRGIRSVDEARQKLLGDHYDDTGGDHDDDSSSQPQPRLKPEVIMGLKHFHDMQVPIRRDEVIGIAEEVRAEAERFGRSRDPDGTVLFEVCGGFRRGKETLHDVDMLVSFRRGNGEPGHEGFVEGLKEALVEKGKLVATLYQGEMGGFTKKKANEISPRKFEREVVLMALWQLPARKCRIDIVQVALPQWPFALLGWSGTVMFEKDVRRYCDEQTKFKLSQKGITIRATETPVDATFRTEEDIFSFLGLDYIPPHLRWA